jgi:hypothetical protein
MSQGALGQALLADKEPFSAIGQDFYHDQVGLRWVAIRALNHSIPPFLFKVSTRKTAGLARDPALKGGQWCSFRRAVSARSKRLARFQAWRRNAKPPCVAAVNLDFDAVYGLLEAVVGATTLAG